METLPEQVLQEVAPAPAHTEIDQLVADMQPLAQAATVDIAWLSQLGPFDAQQALALAASAGDALAQLRANTTAVQDGVIDPFIQYWLARLSRTFVREIGQFGSRSYGLALATSDFDIVCNLQPGASRKAHFDTVLQHIDQDTSGAWTRTQKQDLERGNWKNPGQRFQLRRKYTMKRKLMRRKVSKISSPKQRDLCGG